MNNRDPRIDPQPGDVTCDSSGLVYAIVARFGDDVVTWDRVDGVVNHQIGNWRHGSRVDAVIAVGGKGAVTDGEFPAQVAE